jgi:cobalt-zinc-cadmium efflux system protein
MAHVHGLGHGRAHGGEALERRRGDSRRRMRFALAINLAMLAVELVGGILTGSLAVLADAGHILSDVGAIALALAAARLAARPGGPRQTFGYQRTEVLAALANGLTLVAVAVLIAIEAIGRLSDPPSIEAGGVLALGLFGVAGNVAATLVLVRGHRSDINLEGVLRHSAADALGSLGVVVAGAVVLAGGSSLVDPIVSLAIAVLILASSWRLIREPVDVLMEAAPPGFDMEELQSVFAGVTGVCAVHDLHVWTLTAGFGALSAHVVVEQGSDRDLIRRNLEVAVRDHFGIEHTTLQMEEDAADELLEVEPPPPRA